MADLVTTISESVTINGAVRGSSNSVTTADIVDTFERVVTCINGNVTTIATFGTQPYLDTAAWIEVAIVTSASNYQVLLTPGQSHILCQAEAVALAEEDTSPSFGTLENLASIQVQPVGVSFDPRVEIFAASSE